MSLFGIGAVPVFNAVAGMIGAHQQNKANSAANNQMIEWERERAKNAHQWEVEDLRKAGLNPILSAGGKGASTSSVSIIPSGASPLGSGLNNAVAGMTIQEQLKGLKEDNKLKHQQYDQLDAMMNHFQLLRDDNGEVILDNNGRPTFEHRNLVVENMLQNITSTALNNMRMEEEIKAIRSENVKRKLEADALSSPYGKYIWGVGKAIELAGGVGHAIYGIGKGFHSPKTNISNYNWETGGRNYFNYK